MTQLEDIKDTQMALLNAKLFSRCGESFRDTVAPIKTWESALSSSLTSKWEGTKEDGQREIRTKLYTLLRDAPDQISPEDLKTWNATVDLAKKEIVPQLIEASVRPALLSKGFVTDHKKGDAIEAIKDDFICIVLGAAFRRWVPDSLYLAIADCYIDGHYPCGWSGKFPKGSLQFF